MLYRICLLGDENNLPKCFLNLNLCGLKQKSQLYLVYESYYSHSYCYSPKIYMSCCKNSQTVLVSSVKKTLKENNFFSLKRTFFSFQALKLFIFLLPVPKFFSNSTPNILSSDKGEVRSVFLHIFKLMQSRICNGCFQMVKAPVLDIWSKDLVDMVKMSLTFCTASSKLGDLPLKLLSKRPKASCV